MIVKPIQQQFSKNGFVKLPHFFEPNALRSITQVVEVFHEAWLRDNLAFFQAKAINSSGLTSGQYLTDEQRLVLFKLISNSQLITAVKQVIPAPLFMGSQLFFDPHNTNQTNYWHRDPQYHLSVEEQKSALAGPKVLHVRIPLTADPGIELIPGSHLNWDNDEELQV